MIRPTGLCHLCEHFQGPGCTAYPDGVPDEILYEGFDHRNPAPGDNGILFQPAADIPVEVMTRRLAEYEETFAKAE